MKTYTFYLALSTLAIITLTSSTLRSNGSPGKKTGSPLDKNSCVECHGGTATSVNWISTNIPEAGYKPGEMYVITAEATGSSTRMGFEITAENAVSKQGIFAITDNARTQLTNSNKAVTHSFAGIAASGGKSTWSMNWTAPEKGTGNLSFYAAFNVSNANGTSSGDKIFSSVLSVAEDVSTGTSETELAVNVYPNPASDFLYVKLDKEISSIQLYALTGKAVLEMKGSNLNEEQLDISGLNPGMYILRIQSGKDEIVHKIQIR